MLWRFFTLILAMGSSAFGGVISDVAASGDGSSQALAATGLLVGEDFLADIVLKIAQLIVVFGSGTLGLFILLLAGFRAGSKNALDFWGMIAALLMSLQLVITVANLAFLCYGFFNGMSLARHLGMVITCSASLVAYFTLGNRRLIRKKEHDAARSPRDLSSQS